MTYNVEQMDGERGADGREQMETGADGNAKKSRRKFQNQNPPL